MTASAVMAAAAAIIVVLVAGILVAISRSLPHCVFGSQVCRTAVEVARVRRPAQLDSESSASI